MGTICIEPIVLDAACDAYKRWFYSAVDTSDKWRFDWPSMSFERAFGSKTKFEPDPETELEPGDTKALDDFLNSFAHKE